MNAGGTLPIRKRGILVDKEIDVVVSPVEHHQYESLEKSIRHITHI